MKSGGIKWICIVLIIYVLILPSFSRMGYDIVASTGGQSFQLHRTTGYISFSNEGVVNGTGNFSRLIYIDEFAGIKTKEATSSTKKSDLNYSEKLRLLAREGPVAVKVNLKSYNFTNQTTGQLSFNEAANIAVDELWPTSFVNLKKLYYLGPGIRSRERYENNGDIVGTYIDSWRLSKESLYRASYNRTITNVELTPSYVIVDKSSNKSSSYILGLQSIGSLTNLDIFQQESSNSPLNRVSEEYRGQQKINLRVNMNDYILKPPEIEEWLNCSPCSLFT